MIGWWIAMLGHCKLPFRLQLLISLRCCRGRCVLPFHLQKKIVEMQLLHRTKFMFRYLAARDSEKSSFNFFIFPRRKIMRLRESNYPLQNVFLDSMPTARILYTWNFLESHGNKFLSPKLCSIPNISQRKVLSPIKCCVHIYKAHSFPR